VALRELLVEFGAKFPNKDFSAADAKIGSLKDKLVSLGQALAGAFLVKEVVGFALGVAHQADVLAKQANQLGTSVQGLQAWQHAARLSGVEAGELTSALQKFQRATAEAGEGEIEYAETFKRIGLEVKNAAGELKPTEELLEGVAAAMQQIDDPAKKTQVAMDLFGRAGAKLLPLFNEGPEGIRKLREEMEALGGGFSAEFAESSEEMNDNITRLNVGWLSMKVRIASVLLPIINAAVLTFTKWIVAAVKLAKSTNIVQAVMIVLGAIAAATAFKILSAWGPVIARFGLMALAIIFSALALEDLITFFQGGEGVIGDFLDAWFGPGTSEKVRAWFAMIGNGLSTMLEDARFHSDEFRATWEASLASTEKAFGDTFLGRIGGGILAALMDTFFVIINAISAGWGGALDGITAMAQGLVFSFEVVWEDIVHLTLLAIAKIADATTGALNLASKLPGLGDLATPTGTVSASDREKGRRQKAEGDLFLKAQAIDAKLRGPNRVAVKAGNQPRDGGDQGGTGRRVSEGGETSVTNNFAIAPGTPAAQQRAVANAANRGTKAAFEQRGRK
jgi:hypothetical protein